MTVLASLAAMIDIVETIPTRTALRAALGDIGALVGCPVCLLVLPDPGGSLHAIATPDRPWLSALAPTISQVIHEKRISSPAGLAWSELSDQPLSRAGRTLLHQAHRHGLRSAVSFALAGFRPCPGSVSFAATEARWFSREQRLALAVLATSLGEAGRRLLASTGPCRAALTPRQRECLLWAARGKTDWEIGHILGVREDTIERHLRLARERYDVDKRSMLIVRALFDGTISFEDALGPA